MATARVVQQKQLWHQLALTQFLVDGAFRTFVEPSYLVLSPDVTSLGVETGQTAP